MEKFRLILTIVILISAVFLLFNGLFSPIPIQITLDSGQEVISESPQYFSLSDVLLLVVCAFLIGGTATYLYFESDVVNKVTGMISRNNGESSPILNLLKPDERHAMIALQKSNGEMLQNRLVEKMGLGKVKVTRILARLEQKGLIERTRQGLSNKIKII